MEVYEVGTTSGNHVSRTIGILQNHFNKIKKSDVNPALNNIEGDDIEEDAENYNMQQPSTDVVSDTSFDNGVDGRYAYQQFK